jgi:hypothetical protein
MEELDINFMIVGLEHDSQNSQPFDKTGERKTPISSSQGVNTNAATCSSRARENGRRLDALPNELLVQIMTLMPSVSLWSLRQTSALFLKLFDTKVFYYPHERPGFRDPHMRFSIRVLQNSEIYEAARFIRRDKLHLFS